MKTLKRISALLLAVLLMASFSITAMAEDNDQDNVTITDEIDTNTGNFVFLQGNAIVNENAGNDLCMFDNSHINTNTGSGSVKIMLNGSSIDTNNGSVNEMSNGSSIDINNGSVGTMSGSATIETNNNHVGSMVDNSSIDTNYGSVDYMNVYADITTNYGTVNENNGTITTNAAAVGDKGPGVIQDNKGTIENNHGTVIDNLGSGTVINNYSDGTVNQIFNASQGTVVNNSGTVNVSLPNTVNVVNNFNDGTSDYQGQVYDKATFSNRPAQHEFKNYAEITADGCKVESFDASADDSVVEFDGKFWLEAEDNPSGTVSVTLSESYDSIDTAVTGKSGDVTEQDYDFSVSGSGSSWTLTFTKLIKHIKITLTGRNNPQPDPKPDPKPQPSSPMFVTTYKLKFDLGGGVMPDGKTELELKCSAGQKITLPEAPTREGFTFVGWQTTVRGKTVVLEAGAKFTVTAGKSFVALWEEN